MSTDETNVGGATDGASGSGTAAAEALDKIATLCGCAAWEYPGQVVRDVAVAVTERDAARREADRLREANARLRAVVAALPRCGHPGCGASATGQSEIGGPWCDAHAPLFACDQDDLPWADALRALAEGETR
jgi:hypothetical protein